MRLPSLKSRAGYSATKDTAVEKLPSRMADGIGRPRPRRALSDQSHGTEQCASRAGVRREVDHVAVRRNQPFGRSPAKLIGEPAAERLLVGDHEQRRDVVEFEPGTA